MGVKRVRPKFQTLILNRPSSIWSAFFLFSFNRKLWTPRACVGTNLAWIVIDFSEVHWYYCALSESLAFNLWWRTPVFPLRCARGETNNNTVWCLFFVRLFLILFLGSQRSCFSFFCTFQVTLHSNYILVSLKHNQIYVFREIRLVIRCSQYRRRSLDATVMLNPWLKPRFRWAVITSFIVINLYVYCKGYKPLQPNEFDGAKYIFNRGDSFGGEDSDSKGEFACLVYISCAVLFLNHCLQPPCWNIQLH